MRIVLALCLLVWSAALAAQPAYAQSTTCDRECLRGKITEVLHALVHDDVGRLAVGENLRVTEDGVEKPLAQSGREAAHLNELAEARGLVLMVGHLLLYHPAVDKLRALLRTVKSGTLPMPPCVQSASTAGLSSRDRQDVVV